MEPNQQEPILEIKNLNSFYRQGGGAFSKGRIIQVLRNVNVTIGRGEVLGLVGESGCGKSTLGRLLLGLIQPTEGQVLFDGQDLAQCAPKELRALRRQMQMVFQDTAAALNPRWDVGEILAEPLRIHKLCPPREFASRAEALLERVGLPKHLLGRYPHELSGGQRQRVGIARALARNPDVLFFDEPTSALDPELTKGVLKVIRDLADEQMTMVIVTHEMSFARDVADHIIFMDGGYIVEEGPAEQVINNPQQERTKQFLARYNERP